MKRALFFIILCITLILPAFGQDVLDKPVVIIQMYNTEVITLKKLQTVLEYQKQVYKVSSFTAEEKKFILDEMINEKLVLQAAKHDGIVVSDKDVEKYFLQTLTMQTKQNFDSLDKYLELLKMQGLQESQAKSYLNEQLEAVKKQITLDSYIKQNKREMFENVPQPTEQEIMLFFQDNETQFINPQIVRLNQIFFDTTQADVEQIKGIKAQAEAAYNKIQKGASFDEVMKSVPVNPKSPLQNGDAGYIPRGNEELIAAFGKGFNDSLFKLRKGDIGMIQSKLGYHIVQVTEYFPKKFLTLDDSLTPAEPTTVRDYIKSNLYQNKMKLEYQKAYEEIRDELRDLAELKYFEENL